MIFLGILVAAAALTIIPDANPSLFFYDKFVNNDVYISKFQNKRIWITGASSGIGEELAKQLYGHGAKIILSGRRIPELERVGRSCLSLRMDDVDGDGDGEVDVDGEYGFNGSGDSSTCGKNNNADDSPFTTKCASGGGGNIQLLPFDMTDKDTISEIVETAISYYDGIDILILNAGIGQLSPALDETYDTTRYLMDVNFHSPAQLAMEVIKQDKWGQYNHGHRDKNNDDTNEPKENNNKKREGHIVLTSSVASKLPLPLGSSYAASKHAAHGYFSSLRSECNPWLRVDLPCPGPIQTNFHVKVLNKSKVGEPDKNDNDIANTVEKKQNDDDSGAEVKMAANRCAQLIVAAMSGPKLVMQETWISKQPTLAFMYLNQYLPTLSNWLFGIVGSLRLKAFKAGLPLYKVSSWIKATRMERED